MVIASFAEIASIGLVIPFLTVLMSPEALIKNPYILKLFSVFGAPAEQSAPLLLTILFIFATTSAGIVRLILLKFQLRISHAVGLDMGLKAYRAVLYQPYTYHVNQNSSDILAAITIKINTVVSSIVLPLLTAISAVIISCFILAIMLLVNYKITIFAILLLFTIYILISRAVREKLSSNSKIISEASKDVIKAIQEGLGGIRDVIIDRTQNAYLSKYFGAERVLRHAKAENQFIAGAPKFFIELISISSIAIIAYTITSFDGGVEEAIPLLGALAIAAQRLLPLAQQFYGSITSLRGDERSLDDLLKLVELNESNTTPQKFRGGSQDLVLNEKIELSGVTFRYPGESNFTLQTVNMMVPKGARVAIIGTTGSGKSTLLDVMMGLLQPTEGFVLVDNKKINLVNNCAWQARISHVPQTIFLADATIAENIALGVGLKDIDYDRVKEAAQRARISSTIDSMEFGYHSIVGERGARLSGGQRQRIGLARAFYKNAEVIFLDEATSALDEETESHVMSNLLSTDGHHITLIIVTHRHSILKDCDLVYRVEDGKVLRQY
jgi:ABC-type bacteriocin/lantibiotic exporter with double-glycine peptidase domain